MIHYLKTWSDSFRAVARGDKTHEVRVDDRNFAVGDTLVLQEWVPAHESPCRDVPETDDAPFKCELCGRVDGEPRPGSYTGSKIEVEVTYKTPGGAFGLPEELCVMSIRKTSLPALE